jgi:phage terminase small subunit
VSENTSNRKFTNKQKVFISEYLKSFNATQSAIKAGYSEKTARQLGYRLLTDVHISEAIKLGIAEHAMGADEILTRLADIARGDITDLMDVTTSGFTIDLTDKDHVINPKSKLIKKIKQKVTTYLGKSEGSEDREIIDTEIELYSAQEALQFLAKINGMVTDKTDITTGGEPIVVKLVDDAGS